MSGVWLGASRALDRPVPVTEPYPHICGHVVTGYATGRVVTLWRTACAACAWERGEPRQRVEVTEEMLELERRRLGERDD
jgi:hypothetical protein